MFFIAFASIPASGFLLVALTSLDNGPSLGRVSQINPFLPRRLLLVMTFITTTGSELRQWSLTNSAAKLDIVSDKCPAGAPSQTKERNRSVRRNRPSVVGAITVHCAGPLSLCLELRLHGAHMVIISVDGEDRGGTID